jgi:hypothetical protein
VTKAEGGALGKAEGGFGRGCRAAAAARASVCTTSWVSPHRNARGVRLLFFVRWRTTDSCF